MSYHVSSHCRSRPAEAGNVVMICAVCGGVECGVSAYARGESHVMRGSMSCHVVVVVCVVACGVWFVCAAEREGKGRAVARCRARRRKGVRSGEGWCGEVERVEVMCVCVAAECAERGRGAVEEAYVVCVWCLMSRVSRGVMSCDM